MAAFNNVYIIDTHSLVWYFENSSKLSQNAKQVFNAIDSGKSLGVVPIIVLAELLHLSERHSTPINISKTISRLSEAPNFKIVSLNLMILKLMIPIQTFELHDRAVIATAKFFNAFLVTKDQEIRNSRVIPCVW